MGLLVLHTHNDHTQPGLGHSGVSTHKIYGKDVGRSQPEDQQSGHIYNVPELSDVSDPGGKRKRPEVLAGITPEVLQRAKSK